MCSKESHHGTWNVYARGTDGEARKRLIILWQKASGVTKKKKKNSVPVQECKNGGNDVIWAEVRELT